MVDANAQAKREIVKRMRRYKRPPSLRQFRDRLCRVCGGEERVEELVTELLGDGVLAVTSGVFWLRKAHQHDPVSTV